MQLTILTILGLLATSILAHPGHSIIEEAAERAEYLSLKPRSINSCTGKLHKRGHISNSIVRRREFARYAREKRGLSLRADPAVQHQRQRRDFADYDFPHESSGDISFGDDETLLFADNSSCLLQPEVTQGPFYVDGESIRSDVTEDQAGIPLFLDIQFVDTSTCEPVPAVLVDFWHCNATGVYSGVPVHGNGKEEEEGGDDSNLDATFLRGIQQTDMNGVVQFESVFPGHYTGRATHIHIMSHAIDHTIVRTNGTILDFNGTTHASHVGQIFFDQDLISRVEATEPYNSNTQRLTLNSDDWILKEEAESVDPFVQYILIGDTIEDGIMAWIRVGIDPTVDEEIRSAATIYKDGGVVRHIGFPGGPHGPGGPHVPGDPHGPPDGPPRPPPDERLKRPDAEGSQLNVDGVSTTSRMDDAPSQMTSIPQLELLTQL